ncbi:MAG: threonine synthase [Lachnospiraceae bacterium]|nr:threonine synthase [Lachnospiraceae bacterium]
MDIKYRSTRSNLEVTASEAILQGLSEDGGLFVPTAVPPLPGDLRDLAGLTYQELALKVMGAFLTDFTEEELKACVEGAYDSKFDVPEIAPVVKKDGAYYLELFHGSTIAFKDMALSILPYLMTTAARKNGEHKKIVILTATSGDTGKAAMAGFADVPGTEIIVFYPKDGVSHIQEKQMVTQRGENTHVVAIRGNFDDAQSAVKKIFNDPVMRERIGAAGCRFSSANSINVGRLVPQIVYYVWAYCRLVVQGEIEAGDRINITVPTGNFGNILAAYYAKEMGLPVNKLICASNINKVLADFFETGDYDRRRDFVLTSSPSMDILISSNLERLIYRICGNDPVRCSAFMKSLSEEGAYHITDEMRAQLSDFRGGFAEEAENFAGIRKLYERSGYVIDTHTGIANAVWRRYARESGDSTPTVIASTASPYKFAASVIGAIAPDKAEGKDDFGLIDLLREISGVPEPPAITDIRTAPVRHNTVVDVQDMPEEVCRILGA